MKVDGAAIEWKVKLELGETLQQLRFQCQHTRHGQATPREPVEQAKQPLYHSPVVEAQ
jgi:hypothetical protein